MPQDALKGGRTAQLSSAVFQYLAEILFGNAMMTSQCLASSWKAHHEYQGPD
jgi:hypothetical protein